MFRTPIGVVLTLIICTNAAAAEFASHAPVRPLPQASSRPLAAGPAKFVDGTKGNDENNGTKERPWKTVQHAVGKLQAGDTLYLRAGLYHEHVTATLVGTAEKPITIRAYPGELVTLDGGIPEFQQAPATAWEPCPDGVPGEFRSVKTYPGIETTKGELQVTLLGNFVDSLLPLQGYWHHPDLQSDNPYWTLGGGEKTKPDAHVYCGPGLWYDKATDRIHCRLAHTKLPGLVDNNYRGETDPRKISLVIAAWEHGPVVTLHDCRYVRLQDLVIRGARQNTLDIRGGANIELDGLSLYGGQSCLMAEGVHGLRMAHCACRGLASPWTFRGSLKYRSIESRIVRTGGWEPNGANGESYEMAYCEFTDSVDGVFIGNIHAVAFHHNLVENVSDDAIFATANTAYDGTTPGGGSWFYQNRFARNLTCFAFGVGHGRQRTIEPIDVPGGKPLARKQTGEGFWITRNVFDFRGPVMYRWPDGPNDVQEIDSLGRFGGDHGSPAWEPMWIYHNTLLTGEPSRGEYAMQGIGSAVGLGTRRRVFNNIFCQLKGPVRETPPPTTTDFAADGNLFWSVTDGPAFSGEWCRRFRTSPEFEKSKQAYPPGWTTNDKYAEPKFEAYAAAWPQSVDLRLRSDSPAVDAGVEVPSGWIDPLRSVDTGKPDIGAIPRGVAIWRIGCNGRLDACGNLVANDAPQVAVDWKLPLVPDSQLPRIGGKPAVVVTGYPAFDAPLVTYALRKAGAPVAEVEEAWLDPREYAKYGVVVVDGSFVRGKITPDHFAADELPIVRKFLEDGGTLWLFRERTDLFSDPAGKQWLAELFGFPRRDNTRDFGIRMPGHPWIAHLPTDEESLGWLTSAQGGLFMASGDVILGTPSRKALLGRLPVGKGQIIYTGISPANAMPNGRLPATVADEKRFADQVQILTNIVAELYPKDGRK